MTSKEIIILTHPEDWEPWLASLEAFTDEDIWLQIDPDEPEVEEEALVERPRLPKVKDFNDLATTYAQLTDSEQKKYDASRKYYEMDLKQYQRQKDLMRAVRDRIMETTSKSKKLLLEQKQTTYKWLVKLKEDTKPTDHYMVSQAEQQYTEALKGLKISKVNQWLDRWEHAMKMARKYQLPQISNGNWLKDLSKAIRPISETYGVLYSQQARDPERSDPSEYRKVAMEIREELGSHSKKTPSIVRGSTFNADFGGEEPPSDTEDPKGKGKSTSRKRGGTTSVGKEAPPAKKTTQCQACGYKGHTLQDCWILFEDKRPENYKSTKASEARAKKVQEKVANDKDLAAEVERLKSQERTVDEV